MPATDPDTQALSEALRFPAVREKMVDVSTHCGLDDYSIIDAFERYGYAETVPLLVMLAESACVRVLWEEAKQGRFRAVLDLRDESSPTLLSAHVAALGAAGVERD